MTTQERQGSPGCLGAMGLMFIGLTIALLIGLVAELKLGHEAHDWPSVDGELIAIKVVDRRNDGGTSHRLKGEYRYVVDGETYTSTRIGIYEDADHLGTWHHDTAARLKAESQRRGAVTVFIDPQDPTQALLDRTVRWEVCLFDLIATVLFGGGGLALVFGALYTPTRNDTTTIPGGPEEVPGHAAGVIVIGAVSTAAVLLLAIGIVPTALANGHWIVLAIFLFPAGSILYMLMGVRTLLARRRWGVIHVHPQLPTHPGGELVGYADIDGALPPGATVHVGWSAERRTLYSDPNGGMVPAYDTIYEASGAAEIERHAAPARLRYAFEIPAEHPHTELGTPGTRWLLTLRAEVVGLDLHRVFEIPVQPAAKAPPTIATHQDRYTGRPAPLHSARFVTFREQGTSLWLDFAALRRATHGAGMLAVGMFFAASGALTEWANTGSVAATVFGAALLLFGVLVMGWGAQLLAESAHVQVGPTGLTVSRRWLGITTSTRHIALEALDGLDMSTERTSASDLYWDLQVTLVGGEVVALVEGLPDTPTATATLEHLEAHLAGLGHPISMRVHPEM